MEEHTKSRVIGLRRRADQWASFKATRNPPHRLQRRLARHALVAPVARAHQVWPLKTPSVHRTGLDPV
jgi:hypothetical protein